MDKRRIGHEAARLLPLAEDVLRHYPFRVRSVEHLATHSNVLYRVVTSDGFQCVLRVGSPESDSRKNIDYEVAWLSALNRDTDLEVVSPIRNDYGSLVVDAREPDSDRTRPVCSSVGCRAHPWPTGLGASVTDSWAG